MANTFKVIAQAGLVILLIVSAAFKILIQEKRAIGSYRFASVSWNG